MTARIATRSTWGITLLALAIPASWAQDSSAVAPSHAPPSPQAQVAPQAQVVTQYCTTCHNAKVKSGGLVLDPSEVSHVSTNPETWEKVVRKLKSNSMPPPGMRRPDAKTSAALVSHLETELDRAWVAKPQVGRVPLLHRLSRTEYKNAVRDLLALRNLPKEVDIAYLLPQDNISSGFDNIADLLFLPPSTMERYLDAARKLSRMAVGDPAMPVLVNIHRMDPEHPQDERVDDLPFGTRGGLAIKSDLPVDGTYVVKVELAGAPTAQHQLDIIVDGKTVDSAMIGNEPAAGGGGRAARGATTKPLEFRLPLKAGSTLIGVSFVQHTEARDESVLRPRMRSRGTQPAIASVTVSGPYDVTTPGNSPSRQRIFECRPAKPADEPACAKRILGTLAKRAYRRPVGDAELNDLMPFYERGRKERDFDLGVERAVERLLVSPQFLYRIEREQKNAAPGSAQPVSDLDLASRLSFFIWSSIPDDELLDLAIAGKLRTAGNVQKQVSRMLADPRADSLLTNFAAQWLYLRDIGSKQPDEILFPDFDETLRAALMTETELFLNSILRENRSVLDLLGANYTFLNERLARHYGIPGIRGSYFRKVTLPPGNPRGGLLGQGSMLTNTSYSIRTSPVLRGKWVLENLLSSPPPPPPPNVPSLKTEGSDSGKALTMRQAMVQHRADPVCASCHSRMDPIGFAMENFDAVGRWRDRDGENAIDTSGVFPDGTKFDGIAGLKQELLRHPDLIVSTVAEKMLMFAVGRNLQHYDTPAVRKIVKDAAAKGNTMQALILGVVDSPPFLMREVQGTQPATKQ